LRIVYFTCVPLDSSSGGGQLCCRNHIERLNADPQIDLRVLASGPASAEAETIRYFRSREVEGRFIAYRPIARDARGAPLEGKLGYPSRRWPYLNEVEAREQPHVDAAMKSFVMGEQTDCVVIDYLPSAYFVPRIFSLGIPVTVVTLNREADFYREMVDRKIVLYGRAASRIAWLRLRVVEARIHWRSRLVVTIGKYDKPRQFMGRPNTYWIAPFMDPKRESWVYSATSSLFFVGNQGHFPNRDAIEWLATRFAPELLAVAP